MAARNAGANSTRCATHGHEQLLDVAGHHVVAGLEERPGPDGPLERDAAAHRGAQLRDLELPGRLDERDDPALDERIHVDVLDRAVEGSRPRRRVTTGLDSLERMPVLLVEDDPMLVPGVRVAERGAQEEAVELGLGKQERPLVLDRVLGREQRGTARERPCDAVDRHLPLGHRLEQRRLRLRRRPVDLVHEHDVGEDRPRPELELPASSG